MKNFLYAAVMGLAFGGSVQATTLLETGAPTVTTNRCDAEGCGGSTDWTIIDDFTSAEDWNITGFSFRSEDSNSSGLANYLSTTWTIWDADPFSNAALISGTGNFSSTVIGGGGDWYEFSIDGLDIDLAAGTYWLGHHHDFSTETVFAALATGNTGTYLQTDGDGFQYTGSGVISQQIRTNTVPVPAAVWLFGSALGGLGWMRRRKTV
jgi:hypothetical protein